MYWLLKTEPEEFSIFDLESKKVSIWDGVRNFQARKNIASMKVGDLAYIYHTGGEKSIVGLGEVVSLAYPDPKDESGKFLAIDIKFKMNFAKKLSLDEIKNMNEFSDFALVKQSRLSVMPVDNKFVKVINEKVDI